MRRTSHETRNNPRITITLTTDDSEMTRTERAVVLAMIMGVMFLIPFLFATKAGLI